MRKYNEKQTKRLEEIRERQNVIDPQIKEAFINGEKTLPLNFMLETRFLEVCKHGIDLEARLAYLEEKEPESEELIKTTKRRLDFVKGALHELQNVGSMLGQYAALDYSFECIIEGDEIDNE